MNGKPIILLDVDGACNAISSNPDRSVWPLEKWEYARIKSGGNITYPFLVARPVLDFFSRIHQDGLAEIRWHTTWQEEANTRFGKEFGLPRFPVVPAAEEFDGWVTDTGQGWWKIPPLMRVLEEDRPVIWIDDEIGLSGNVSAPNLQTIRPRSHIGLTPNNLRSIESKLVAVDPS